MFVGAPGEDAFFAEVDHNKNPFDQTKEAALKDHQSQKQLANAPKAEELKRKKQQVHHMKNSASQPFMLKATNPF